MHRHLRRQPRGVRDRLERGDEQWGHGLRLSGPISGHNLASGSATGVTVIGAGEGDDPASNTVLDANGAQHVMEIPKCWGRSSWNACASPAARQALPAAASSIERHDTAHDGVHGQRQYQRRRRRRHLRSEQCDAGDDALHRPRQPRHRDPSSGRRHPRGGTTTLTDCLVEENSAATLAAVCMSPAGRPPWPGPPRCAAMWRNHGGGIFATPGTLVIAESCRVTENTAIDTGAGGGIFYGGGTVTLQGADPSPSWSTTVSITVPRRAPSPSAQPTRFRLVPSGADGVGRCRLALGPETLHGRHALRPARRRACD